MDEITVTFFDHDESLPSDVEVIPPLEEMEPEAAIRHLVEFWGLGEADARFELALARGEIDGDAYAVDDDGRPVRTPRQDRA